MPRRAKGAEAGGERRCGQQRDSGPARAPRNFSEPAATGAAPVTRRSVSSARAPGPCSGSPPPATRSYGCGSTSSRSARRTLDGPDEPLWWTLRRPIRPLSYDAARMVFTRANETLGANWTLHDLRHSAAKRMVRDPKLSLTDVQWVLGHLHISTTEQYLEPAEDEVVAHVLAHHARQPAEPVKPVMPAPGYRSEVLQTLLGTAVLGGGPA
ncbi:tyrosine-type recombinase/integrase [Streptomyces sp. NPDC008121]|uniref:tyrosine-type recombinase/integrase n=1 Tax=Streptomyces sp. NPDC008121 TaxID=3364809 RepID=UPI0036EA332A